MIEKMEAGILGFAVGDALGVPVEFVDRKILQRHNVKDMMGYGSHQVPEGTWSDDTSLMLATIDSIRENGKIDYEDIMSKFTEWVDYAKYTATDEVFDIGIATRKAIINYKQGIEAINCGAKGLYENGNGSLMRILPFVYYLNLGSFTEKEKTDIIDKASSLTHAHEISKLGCNIYADYVSFLLKGIDKFEALELLQKIDYKKFYSEESISQYNRILIGDLPSLSMEDIKSSGYVVDTLEASIWCTLNNNNYEDAVISAVNLGDDTDTVGAVTGALNGIIYSKHAIPERWINVLKRREFLEQFTNEFIENINNGTKKRR